VDATRDATTGITTREPDYSGVLVELTGEFDTCALEPLRGALGDALDCGLSTCVELSGVTFLDMRCNRELAVQCRLHGGHLVLCDPSWQVEARFKACGFQDQIDSLPW